MHLFKIWNQTRCKKTFVAVEEENVYLNLIVKASQKLDINGSMLVLESDGTVIDEDEILISLKQETLIILQKNEVWMPVIPNSLSNTPSLASTDTVLNTSISGSLSSFSLTTPENVSLEETQASFSGESASNERQISIEIIDCNLESLWVNFQVPWDKIPLDMIAQCENGKRDKYTITEIVHTVVNEMRQVREPIPSKAFTIVANKMVQKYPQTFQDVDDDGILLGDGACSLKSKLQERYFYLRRPHKRKASCSNTTPIQYRKRQRNAAAGCSLWSEEKSSPTVDSAKNKLTQMDFQTEEELNRMLEETYSDQRKFLNNYEDPPTVELIKKTWPILFHPSAIKWHFQKLTNNNIENLGKNIQIKAEKIINFGLKQKILLETDIGTGSREQLSLKILSKYLKEDINQFWYKLKTEEDVDANLNINEPCIVEFDEKPNEFDIYMEHQRVVTTEHFLDALNLSFALYFIFNLQYPKQISTTLEMLQRYYLKIHPDSGTKSKKLSASKRKVITLMNKLRDL